MDNLSDQKTCDAEGLNPPTRPLSWWSGLRKWLLLALFCLVQFLETFNASAIYVALPDVHDAFSLSLEEDTWLIAGYQLPFAAFMLMSGRVCDVYHPKLVFVIGCCLFGVSSLIIGFIRIKILLLVLRAFTGLAAAMMSPSALHLIVLNFKTPSHRATAIGCFGATAGIGTVLGLTLGAIIVQFTTWQWLFWISAIASLSVSVLSLIAIPAEGAGQRNIREKPTEIDIVGVASVTSALILLIFAVTSGSSTSWHSARFIAPLIVCVFLLGFFVYWEYTIPERKAAMPPRLWRYPAFTLLVTTPMIPFLWFSCILFFFTSWWQDVFGWGTLSAGTHFLPIGITFLLAMPLASRLPDIVSTRWMLVCGNGIIAGGTVLFTSADRPSRYWSFILPGLILGTTGVAVVFAAANIMVFRATPPSMAGTVGALFNAAVQLGSAIGIPIVSAIQIAVDGDDTSKFQGRAVAFWVMFGLSVSQMVISGVLYPTKLVAHDDRPPGDDTDAKDS